jgi:hypothetical protein
MRPILLLLLSCTIWCCTGKQKAVPAFNDDTVDKAVIDVPYKPVTIDEKSAPEDDPYILKGTTVLRGSDKNLEARWVHGLGLDKIESSDCKYSGEHPTPTEITAVSRSNDSTLVVTANIFVNCGQKFLCEIEVKNRNTLNLLYHGYGNYASCSCCFSLTYTISLINNADTDLSRIKYVTIDGVDKTSLPGLR